MIRMFNGYEGDTERPLFRRITEYECTCDKCGGQMSLEDKVYDFGDGRVCQACLCKEFLIGDVESLLTS